jgi:prolipoprotein diacylglyceryltransferase
MKTLFAPIQCIIKLSDRISPLLAISAIAVVIGARLLYVAISERVYYQEPLRARFLTGLVAFCGAIFGIACM